MFCRSLVIIISVILLFGCQKEKIDPSGDPTEKPITNAAIGAEGGILKNDSITVTIPEGAFSENEEIALTTLSDSSCFGDYLSSGRFRLEGLPESYDKPLKVRIAHDGELEDESFLVVGEEALNLETGESEIYYEFLEVVDSSGFVICEIPGTDLSESGTNLKNLSITSTKKTWISIEVVSAFFTTIYRKQDMNYKIFLPANRNDAFSPKIIHWLDAAYSMIGLVLFPGLPPEQIKPFHIYLASLPGTQYCRFAWKNGTEDNSKKPKGILAININKLEDTDKMHVMIGREVLRSVLFTFDPKYPRMRPIDQIQHHWLDQALITWSESLLTSENNPISFIPSDFPGNELKPFQGMHAGILQGEGSIVHNITDHGRGMASFMQYISPEKSRDYLTLTYTAIANGSHPVDALASFIYLLSESTDSNLYLIIAWYYFLADYLLGKIYNVPGNIFLSGIPEANVFDINGENDTVRIFQNIYPDLSAGLFRINLNDPGFGESGTLEFSVTGGNATKENLGGFLCGYQGGNITLLGEMKKIFTYDEFQSYNSLIFLLCNANGNVPYTGNSTIELTVKAKRKKLLPYNYCELELYEISGEHQVEFEPAINEPYNSTFNVFNTWKFKGNCDENSFTGTLDPSFYPENRTGTINVTFDDDQNITHFNVTCYDRTLLADHLSWDIIGTSITKTYQSGYYLQHEVSGAQVCTPLQGLYHYSEAPYIPGVYYMYTLLSHSCTESSRIKFSFRKD